MMIHIKTIRAHKIGFPEESTKKIKKNVRSAKLNILKHSYCFNIHARIHIYYTSTCYCMYIKGSDKHSATPTNSRRNCFAGGKKVEKVETRRVPYGVQG